MKKSLEAAKETTDAIGKIADLEEDELKKKDKVVVEGASLSDVIVSRTRSAAATFLIVVVLVYFLLSRGQSTLDRVGEEMEKGGSGKMWVGILSQVQHQVARYLFTVAAGLAFLKYRKNTR